MADEEHLKKLREGAEAWNAWRKENPDVHRADLRSADLSDANLSDANLDGADLSGAYLIRADLFNATLLGSNLSDAFLIGANLGSANLSDADLRSANLGVAFLSKTHTIDTDFKRANLSGTVLALMDLRQAKGLEQVIHKGASEVSNTTLARSKGKIPDAFLKGCGLSDWEIVAAKLHDPDLTSGQVTDLVYEIERIKADSPIQINPVFFSYSRKDSEFVDAVEKRFDDKRIRYWRDTRHATSGPLEDIVDKAMHHGRIVLLILSKDSVESDWVQWEVKKARKLAKESKEHVLCPIALDASWETCRWPERLRDQVAEYNILDFSEWEDEDALVAAFQRLIDGLGIYYPKDVGTATVQR